MAKYNQTQMSKVAVYYELEWVTLFRVRFFAMRPCSTSSAWLLHSAHFFYFLLCEKKSKNSPQKKAGTGSWTLARPCHTHAGTPRRTFRWYMNKWDFLPRKRKMHAQRPLFWPEVFSLTAAFELFIAKHHRTSLLESCWFTFFSYDYEVRI